MKRKMNIKQIIAFSAVSLLCIFPIVMGIVMLFDGWLINLPFFICFLAIPLAVIAVAYLAITSSCNVWSKVIMCAAMVWIGGSLLLAFLDFCCFERLVSTKGEKAEGSYKSEDKIYKFMPSVDEIGEPMRLEYHDYYAFENVHGWYSHTLIAAYSETDYDTQKLLTEEKYTFVDGLLRNYDGSTCDSVCSVKGYTFRVVELDDATWFMMIATNDRTQEIVYVSFYCECMDKIKSLESFILDECGWEHIR